MSDNNLFGPDEVNPHPLGGTYLARARGYGLEVMIDGAPSWVAVFWAGEIPNGHVEIRGWGASTVDRVLCEREGESLTTLALSEVTLARSDPAAILAALTVLMSGRTDVGGARKLNSFGGEK
jgi:hypothetical protein